jgi:hypothetical protein
MFKAFTFIILVSSALTLPVVFMSCSHSASTLPSSDLEACETVISDACAAFNAYDLDTFLSYLTPTYAVDGRSAIETTMQQFEAGKIIGVKMVVSDFQQPQISSNGVVMRFKLSYVPNVHQAQTGICIMQKINGVWKIDSIVEQ